MPLDFNKMAGSLRKINHTCDSIVHRGENTYRISRLKLDLNCDQKSAYSMTATLNILGTVIKRVQALKLKVNDS